MRFLRLMRLLGIAAQILLWTLLFALALGLSAMQHLQGPAARRIARELTQRFVNHEIRGELQIGRIDELSLDHITVRHAQLLDGEGRRIISAQRVILEPDFAALRHGLLHFRVGRVTGGTVRLVDNGQSEPSLLTTFDSRRPGPPSSEPLHALVDQLIVEDVTLYGQIVQLHGVRANHVYARGRLAVGRGVDVEVYEGRGTMVQPFDFVGEVVKLTGSVSSDTTRGVKLEMAGTRDNGNDAEDEEVRVSLAFRSPVAHAPQQLDIDILSDNLRPDTLRRVGYAFAEPLAPPLRGHVRLTGPPEDLQLSAQVDSRAGHADVQGRIQSNQGVSVRVASQRIELAKLVDGAPSVTVKGTLDVSVGPAEDAKPQVHLELAGLHYGVIAVPPFVLDGVLEEHGVRIEHARATRGGQIAVRGRAGFDGGTDLQVDARFPALERDPNLSRFVDGLEGSLNASLHVRTPPAEQKRRLDIEGKLELNQASFGSLRAQHVVVTGKAEGDPELPQLDVSVRADDMQALSYHLGNAKFSLQGGPRNYAARGEFNAQGQRTFSFDASVTADRKGFVVQADPIEFSVGSESWRGAIDNLTVLHEHSVELGFLRLGSRAQRLEARGILRLAGEDELHAQLQNFDLTALRAVLGDAFPFSAGYADANLELHGDVERPQLSLTGAVRESTVAKLQNIDALYTISYNNGHLEFDTDVDLQARGELQMAGQGELDASVPDPREALRSGLYNLSLSGKHVDLTLFPGLASGLQSGRLEGQLDAQGGLDAINVDGQLAVHELRVVGWQPLELDGRFNYNHNELTGRISASDAHGDLGRLRVRWQADWRTLTDNPREYLAQELQNQDFSVRGHLNKRPVAQLPFRAASWPVQLEGSLKLERANDALQGAADAELTPSENVNDPTCQISGGTSIKAHAQLNDDELTAKVEALLGTQSIAAARGSLSWPFVHFFRGLPTDAPPKYTLDGQLKLDHLEQAPVLCRRAHGKARASFALHSASGEAPYADVVLDAKVVPQGLGIDGVTPAPVARCLKEPLSLHGTLHGDAHSLAIDANSSGCSGGPAELQARMPWTWSSDELWPQRDQARDTSVRVALKESELEPLLDYLPGVRGFSAQASGELNVKQRQGKVDARGQLALSGGRLYLIPTGQELRDIAIIIAANGNWLKLDAANARIGQGKLQLAGGFMLDGLWPRHFQLGLVTQDLPIEREGIELARLTGSAALVGDIEAKRSRTAIKLHSLAVRLPSASNRSLQALEPHTDITLVNEPKRTHAEEPYNFEFAIDGRNQLTARRNDFEATLATELDVSYRDPALHVGGYIEFRRGTFELFGKRFELNRGSMQFDGSSELNPDISLVATHEPSVSGGSSVVVNVRGTLAKPQVGFYSERCPGEGAVVLLVSGRCPTEGDMSSSGAANNTNANATPDAFAAGIIGGVLTLGAQRELGGLVPRLAVESSGLGTRTRVKAGFEAVPPFMRSLVERVYLQGAISTADQNATSTSSATTPDFLLELYFPNHIVGSGKVAPTTRSWGVDVTWEP